VAILAFAENEFSTTTGEKPGAWPFDLIDNAHQISEARKVSDYVLVILHGGAEHYPLPSPTMQKACRFFVDMGADAVICHHSHVAAGSETYKGCPLVYGLGNFLFDPGNLSVDGGWNSGYVVALKVSPHHTIAMDRIPYRQEPKVPRVTLLAGAERETFLASLDELSAIITHPEQLKRSWAEFCKGRRSNLLGSLLCLSRGESWLLDRNRLPEAILRLTPNHVARLRNLFSCESHADACRQMLTDLLKEKTAGR
jgi:poly-gamma-glutamate synthesis protein (capsule biosynthesis protein)